MISLLFQVDGELKIRGRGRIGRGAWLPVAFHVALPLRLGCRLQRHHPVPLHQCATSVSVSSVCIA